MKAPLYHGTHPENIPSILAYGLRTNELGWCYLTPSLEEARQYGGAVLVIDPPENVRLGSLEDCEGWEVLCFGTVPPDRILVKEIVNG